MHWQTRAPVSRCILLRQALMSASCFGQASRGLHEQRRMYPSGPPFIMFRKHPAISSKKLLLNLSPLHQKQSNPCPPAGGSEQVTPAPPITPCPATVTRVHDFAVRHRHLRKRSAELRTGVKVHPFFGFHWSNASTPLHAKMHSPTTSS
jgi:hypothetical protein